MRWNVMVGENLKSHLRMRIKCAFFSMALMIGLAGASVANAGIMYNFIDDTNLDVLATLTLSSVPAQSNDFELLTFTAAGRSVFNNGDLIKDFTLGDFMAFRSLERVVNVEIDIPGVPDIPDALASNMMDDTVAKGENDDEDLVDLTFYYEGDFVDPASRPPGIAELTFTNFELDKVSRAGYWELVSVPEPSSIALWGCLAAVGLAGNLRRKRRA